MENLTSTTITTIKSVEQSSYNTYDDNKDIIWPTVVGIFVALALGWMICRYKCSSKERSPHIVRCCPKSLCKNIRLCCMCLLRIKQEENTNPDLGMHISNKPRASDNSLQEVPFLAPNSTISRLSLVQATQQWPPPFILNQSPSFPLSITVQPTVAVSEPKRHPLRRESILPGMNNGRRESSLWPFRTINAVFHKQTSEIKENDLFFTT